MKKEKLIETIVTQSGVDKKHVNAVLKAFTQITANELKEEGKFQVSGLGSFKVCTRKSCINPKTKEKIELAEKQLSILAPENSSIRSIILTDEQFQKMKIISGEATMGEKISNSKILEF